MKFFNKAKMNKALNKLSDLTNWLRAASVDNSPEKIQSAVDEIAGEIDKYVDVIGRAFEQGKLVVKTDADD